MQAPRLHRPLVMKRRTMPSGWGPDDLIAEIEAAARAHTAELGKSAFDPRVIEAIREVPRHLFVREADQARAYWDQPLPIGWGQTISAPFVVAAMTDALALEPT